MKPTQISWNKRIIVLGSAAFILCTSAFVFAAEGENGITGRVLLGPQCAAMRSGMEEQCKDKPLQTRLVVLTGEADREIVRFDSDAQGGFRVVLPAGDYIISSEAGKPYPICREEVNVSAGQFTDAVVHCETGIR